MKRVGDPRTHAVIGLTSGQDHLRVMPDLLREVAEIIRIDADAVPPNEAGLETEKVPLGARRVEHIPDGKVDPREDLRDLVDEGDVDVALRVLDRLGGFGR